jgi:predicted nucleotidyltransferase
MTVVTEKVLAVIVQVIVREVDPERIYLFGSRARGNARADSDVDLLIVERKSFGPQHSRFLEINRVYRVLSSFRVPKDILLYSDDEFAKWRSSINHVVGRCNREGKLLYERP